MTTPLLAIEGLTKSFGGLRAVGGMAIDVGAGEVVGLLGPNGSGKTTVLNLVSGNLRPDAGSIRFGGAEIAGRAAHRLAREGIARTFQLVRVLGDMTALENVEAGLAFRLEPVWGAAALEESERLLARVGLAGQSGRPAADLTYIDQKRLELARALALRPKLLLLDEWLAGLNATELASGIDLIRSLRDDGLTVLMIEHVMHAIHALCDRCVVMNAGQRIAAGPPDEVLRDPAVVTAYLGEPHA